MKWTQLLVLLAAVIVPTFAMSHLDHDHDDRAPCRWCQGS